MVPGCGLGLAARDWPSGSKSHSRDRTEGADESWETEQRESEEAYEMCPTQTHLAKLDPHYHSRFGILISFQELPKC